MSDTYGLFTYGDIRGTNIVGEGSVGIYKQPIQLAVISKNVEVQDTGYSKSVNCQIPTKCYPIKYKQAYVFDTKTRYFNDYIVTVNKTVTTNGYPMPTISSFKGPTKSASVDLVTVENNVGQNGSANVDGITLNLAVNQFIRLKVDVKGAKINGLPQGFTFANDEITGAGTTAGSYRCNIVTDAVSIPVRINISNIIRIS
jgi:hypothetical protein